MAITSFCPHCKNLHTFPDSFEVINCLFCNDEIKSADLIILKNETVIRPNLSKEHKDDTEKSFQTITVTIILAIIAAIVTFTLNHLGAVENKNIPKFIGEDLIANLTILYEQIPVQIRFCYFMWLMLFINYWHANQILKFVGNYDRKIWSKNWANSIFFTLSLFLVANHMMIINGKYKEYLIITDSFWFQTLTTISILAMFFGLYIVLRGRAVIDGYWGPHIYEYSDPLQRKLVTTDIYKRRRHPIYWGQIIMSIATMFLINNWIGALFAGLVILTNVLRARREDEYLKLEFNEVFDNYKKTTFW